MTSRSEDDGSNMDSKFDFHNDDEELKNVATTLFVKKLKKLLKC